MGHNNLAGLVHSSAGKHRRLWQKRQLIGGGWEMAMGILVMKLV